MCVYACTGVTEYFSGLKGKKTFKEKENMESKEELLMRYRNLKYRIKVKRQLKAYKFYLEDTSFTCCRPSLLVLLFANL